MPEKRFQTDRALRTDRFMLRLDVAATADEMDADTRDGEPEQLASRGL